MSNLNCGIYIIKNKDTGKIYIGSSMKLSRRFYQHRRDLKSNNHHSIKLQRSWNKHGEDSFEFSVVLYTDPCDLLLFEQSFLDHYRCYENEIGYNICSEAGSNAGYKYTKEQKLKHKENKRKSAHKYRWKGSQLCLAEIAEKENICEKSLCRRVLEEGWGLYKAVNTPINHNGKKLEAFGKSLTVQEWSESTGISYSTIKGRLRNGWANEKALSPIQQQETLVEYNGFNRNINQWSEVTGIPASTISQRLNRLGWNVEDALTIPKGERRNK